MRTTQTLYFSLNDGLFNLMTSFILLTNFVIATMIGRTTKCSATVLLSKVKVKFTIELNNLKTQLNILGYE